MIGLVLLFSAFLVILFVRSISKALTAMTSAMDQLAQGDLKVEIPAKRRTDELGAMARSMGVMVSTLDRFVKAQIEMACAHNQDGRISHTMRAHDFPGAYGDMARNVNEMVKSHIDVQMQFLDYMVEYIRANFEHRMAELPGERQRISNTAEKIRVELEADKAGFMLEMAQGLNAVLSTNEHALAEISSVLKALAEGDLTCTIDADFEGVFAELKDNSNGTIERLRAIIMQIREATDSINAASGEIATGNNDLSRRTEEQASSLEETASSIEELAATVRQNAENAQQANQLAAEGVRERG